MTTKDMEKETTETKDVKVDEKRVRPSVIRRRARKVEETPKGAAAPKKVSKKVKPGEAGKEAEPEKGAVKKAAKTKVAAEKKGAPEKKPAAKAKKAVKKKPAAEEGEEKAPASAKEKETAEAKKPQHKKEVKVFEKTGQPKELKKFFTSGRPQRKGKRQRTRQPRRQKTQVPLSRQLKKTEITVPKATKRVVRIAEAISIAELSQRLGVKANELIKKLMGLGVMATVNQFVDIESATLLAQEYGYDVENVSFQEGTYLETEAEQTAEGLEPRAPVVTVMGHVDHGKTSLLDAIRKTNVVSGEAGGITQHIGAYHVHLEKGDVTFLDTPGHEAFTSMRARGAKVTDLVVLVVAADDGVMPQTIEAINHAKAAGVPIIVAVNKIDLPQAEPDRVKSELAQHGLAPEDWGGEAIFVEVSAKQGTNIKELLELILLQAEMLELKGSPEGAARGVIVEAKLDKGRGPVATVLIQNGRLRVGDAFVTGVHYGRVRAMISDWGKRIKEAGPSMPVEILGLSGVPQAGDTFMAVKDEVVARQISSIRERKALERERTKTARVSLEELYDQINKGEVKELGVIIKADVNGSIGAVKDSLEKLSTEAVKINVLHSAAGGINEGDVILASASNAIIIGFNVRPEVKAAALAEKENVDLRLYNVIYNL
ncbi:MAG: translation initiation factor IF-2, partial [Thermodesulfobacteriota bacterium]